VRLEYDAAEPAAPATIIAKLASEPGPVRDIADRFGMYGREVTFYRELAPRVGLPVPLMYHGECDGSGGFVLLLEDMAPAHAGDLLAGCTLEQAAALLQRLAAWHAHWWDSPELDGLDWLLEPNDHATLDFAADVASTAWATFRRRFGEHLPPPVVELGDRLGADRSVLDRLARPPRTLVHGDLRINNLMFGDREGLNLRAVLDWQTPLRARAPMDIARLLVNNLQPDDRRIAERVLLPAYHRALVGHGVRGYGFDDCWLDYRLAVINLFGQVVVLSSLLDVDGEIGDDLGPVTGTRLVVALLDLDLARLLPRASTSGGIPRWLAPLKKLVRPDG